MLDGLAVGALRRAIAEIKQRWSVIRWVTKNLLSRAPLCFRRYFKPLVPTAFAVVSTHQSALGSCGGLWPVLLVSIRKEGLCPSSGDINRLTMFFIAGVGIPILVLPGTTIYDQFTLLDKYNNNFRNIVTQLINS
jgi:hypothetical protein